ncbi:hypothetical protein QYF36_016595 [Acer negundo]|nr:hypothetical protein QYF36_016595 [Acer negundo]
MLHDKLLTNHQRASCGLTFDISCPRCDIGIEDTEHLIHRCTTSILVWEKISRDTRNIELFDGSFEDWLYDNLHVTKITTSNVPFSLVFSLTLWFLWKLRCKKVFDTNFEFPQSPHLIIEQFAKDWWSANYDVPNSVTFSLPVSWIQPNDDWGEIMSQVTNEPAGKIIGVSISILITVVVFLRFKLGKEREHHDSGAQAIRGNQADFADFEAN